MLCGLVKSWPWVPGGWQRHLKALRSLKTRFCQIPLIGSQGDRGDEGAAGVGLDGPDGDQGLQGTGPVTTVNHLCVLAPFPSSLTVWGSTGWQCLGSDEGVAFEARFWTV